MKPSSPPRSLNLAEEMRKNLDDVLMDLQEAYLQIESLRAQLALANETLVAERTAWSVRAAELYNEIDTLRTRWLSQ